MKTFEGLIAAPFTPFKINGDLNLEVVEGQVRLLLDNGVKGVFVGGTTGEGMSLTIEERKMLVEKWIEIAPGDFQVFVQCGHTTLASCRELAAHAKRSGADAIGAMAPFFYRPDRVEDLVAFTGDIASAAPELPFYYYHMPSMTGVNFSMIDYLELSSGRIPNLAGMKFTDENLMEFKLCSEYKGRKYEMLYGRDETLLCGLTLGASGAIGSTYNYNGSIYNEIIEAWEEGDVKRANELQYEVMKFVRILNKYGGGIVAGKAIMKLAGVDCGPLRSPLCSLSETKFLALKEELEKLDYFKSSKIKLT